MLDSNPLSEHLAIRSAKEREIVTVPVGILRPHPSYVGHHLAVSSSQLATIAALGDFAFQQPLTITQGHIVLDGYARWELAKRQGRQTLECVECDLNPEDALTFFIRTRASVRGLVDFIRIELALEMEPYFQEKAVWHQAMGGENKGLSRLAKAQRIDTRQEIAKLAGVGAGNVQKVKNILERASPDLLRAVREEEVSINMADRWCNGSKAEQSENLRLWRIEKGIAKKVRLLMPVNKATSAGKVRSEALPVRDFINLLDPANPSGPPLPPDFQVEIVRVPGKGIFMTEELARDLTKR